jgi:hypothetical protein
MDISKYLGSAFRKVADVRVNGPLRMFIARVVEGKFDKPDLVFDDGTRLSLSVTNTRNLVRDYGTDAADWIGKEIELYVGETEYEGNALGREEDAGGRDDTGAENPSGAGQRHGRRYRLLTIRPSSPTAVAARVLIDEPQRTRRCA